MDNQGIQGLLGINLHRHRHWRHTMLMIGLGTHTGMRTETHMTNGRKLRTAGKRRDSTRG